MIETGNPEALGATLTEDGCSFSVYSSSADFIELCLFDANGAETMNYRLPGCDRHVHHGFLPGLRAGQRYGYRAHGRWDPQRGLRHNPAKLLLDPYARELAGAFRWDSAVFAYQQNDPLLPDRQDSAPFVPRSVTGPPSAAPGPAVSIPWPDTVIYEANLRGFTMRHPALEEADRGRFSGLTHSAVIDYLKSLGVSSIELLPVQAWIDEPHLVQRSLRNFWGYNTIAFMAPMPRLARRCATAEFCAMLRALHEAGLEVILDVAFNHTGEGDGRGPTLGFRGLDNLAYYRTFPDEPERYINDTGTGNTVNADHPAVQRLVIDSLKHWAALGVDGFRFDLAPILGRHADGFSRRHPLLAAIGSEPALRGLKLIAEPWDPGPGGYQLGQFPRGWAEWNDRFRDGVRRFWRRDRGMAGDFASRLHGSADLFDRRGRQPFASINYVAAHDGFTLADAVSYEQRHNDANGEGNRDGHAHNYSANHGVEGPTDDDEIAASRRLHRLNMLASLLLSQGTPMLLAGDEFGNSQQGNNNAYAQDNDTGWLDWQGLERDPEFTDAVRALVRIRRRSPLLRLSGDGYIHDGLDTDGGRVTIDWLNAEGVKLAEHEWTSGRSKLVHLECRRHQRVVDALAIVVNGDGKPRRFTLPAPLDRVLFASSGGQLEAGRYRAAACSMALIGTAAGREGVTTR